MEPPRTPQRALSGRGHVTGVKNTPGHVTERGPVTDIEDTSSKVLS